jgi:hypothetical protein
VTQKPPEDQWHWEQPDWDSPIDESEQDPPKPTGELAEPLAGGVIVPVSRPASPSVVESGLRVISGIVWPVAIVLAILGFGGWVLNMALAFVVSALLGNLATELKRRRKGIS